jgi:hypothetical protein
MSIGLHQGGPDDDLSFTMAAERLPGYAGKFGRWEEAVHRAAMPRQATAICWTCPRMAARPPAVSIVQGIGKTIETSISSGSP